MPASWFGRRSVPALSEKKKILRIKAEPQTVLNGLFGRADDLHLLFRLACCPAMVGGASWRGRTVIAEGNKIKGNAIPVSAPYRLRDCAFVSPDASSFPGMRMASVLCKRLTSMRFRVSGTDKVRISQRQERTRKSVVLYRKVSGKRDRQRRRSMPPVSEKHAANGENRCRSKVFAPGKSGK